MLSQIFSAQGLTLSKTRAPEGSPAKIVKARKLLEEASAPESEPARGRPPESAPQPDPPRSTSPKAPPDISQLIRETLAGFQQEMTSQIVQQVTAALQAQAMPQLVQQVSEIFKAQVEPISAQMEEKLHIHTANVDAKLENMQASTHDMINDMAARMERLELKEKEASFVVYGI